MPDRVDIRTELEFYSALERGETISQFALSQHLSVSAGLINALLKRVLRKGLAKARAVPPRRWAYYLTPRGFAEKSRLVAAYLEQSLAFFREARAEYADLFARLRASGVQRVVLVGKGELAEIAILAAREAEAEIAGVFDFWTNDTLLYGLPVLRRSDEVDSAAVLVITELREPQMVFDRMRAQHAGHRIEAPSFLRISESGRKDGRR